MIVVADSGPLHYLILLDQAELLHRFYGQVVVPEANDGMRSIWSYKALQIHSPQEVATYEEGL